ncbi:MAG: glycosyltransferase [Clostridiales Family XIII bacterium]|nr:glycosyltransferase [Clostridiales Family XIII bacterium]
MDEKNNRIPNVLYLDSALEMGGAERLLVDLFTCHMEMDTIRLKLSYLIMNDKIDRSLQEVLLASGAHGDFWNRREGDKNISWLFKLRKHIRNNGINIIHTNTTGSKYWGMVMKLLCPGVKLVHTVHNAFEVPKYTRFQLQLSRRFVNHFVAISSIAYEQCINRDLTKVSKIYNGFAVSECRQKVDYDIDGIPEIVLLGRLVPEQKGHDIVLEALSICLARSVPIRITFFGDDTGPYAQAYHLLLKQMERLEIPKDLVVFKGQVDDARSQLADFDLYISAAPNEGFGIAVVEAMASKIPVIVSASGGPLEYTEDGVNGFLFQPKDAQSLADTIINVVHLSPQQRKDVATRSRQTAMSYDISNMYHLYSELYRRLINK